MLQSHTEVHLCYVSMLQGWVSLTTTFFGKFGYTLLTILFCYGSAPVDYGNWSTLRMSYLRVWLSADSAKNTS